MKKMLLVMAVIMALMVPSMVRADSLVPKLVSVVAVGSQWDWTYSIRLASGSAWAAETIGGVGTIPPTLGSAMLQFYDFLGYDADGADNNLTTVGDNYLVSHTLNDGPDQIAGNADDGFGTADWVIFPNLAGGTDPDGPDNTFGTSDDQGVPLGGPCGLSSCPPDSSSVWNVLFAYRVGPTIDAELLNILMGYVTIRSDIGQAWDGTGTSPFNTFNEAYFTQDSQNDGPGLPCVGSSCTNPVQSNFGLYESPSAIPEPTSMLLLGTGLLGLGSRLRKKSKKDTPSV